METLSKPLGGDENRGPAFLAVALPVFALALLSVVLRFFTRLRILGVTGWDDVLILLAMAFSMITATFNIIGVDAGFGRHTYYLSPSQTFKVVKFLIFSEITFALSLAISKASICLFLLSLIKKSPHSKSKRIFLHFTMGLLFITTVIVISQLVAQCRPTPKLWNPTIPGTCENRSVQEKLSFFNGAVAAWVDFSLAAFPIFFIKDLQLSMKDKIGLCGLLSAGVFAGICAIIRTDLESSLLSRADITWNPVGASTWAVVEANVSIIVACIPAMKPLYASLAGKLSSKRESYGFIGGDLESSRHRRHSSRAQGLRSYPMMPISVTQGSGSQRELKSDAGMPGVV